MPSVPLPGTRSRRRAWLWEGRARARATGGGHQNTYDALGNLTRVQNSAGTDIHYTIDALGRRIAKNLNGTLTQYAWSGELRIIAQLDGSGAVNQRFIYGNNLNVPALIVRIDPTNGDKTYRVITDQLGSPVYVVNITDPGDVLLDAEYDEWGNVVTFTSSTGSWPIPFGFAGGLYDADTKLVRFGARDYDARVGRWTSKDPILFAGGSANLYIYVDNQPLNLLDPLGTDAWSAAENFGFGILEGGVGTAVAGAGEALLGSWFAVAAAGYAGFSVGKSIVEVGFGDDWETLRPLSTDERLDRLARLGGLLLGGGIANSRGNELAGNGWRFAPFGNRTGRLDGELPHYHRSVGDPCTPGQSVPGQGIGRHRPWQKKSPDRSFLDRF